MDRQETVAALETCYSSMLELGQSLSEAEWQTPSLCPDWDVAGVYLHLASLEAAMVDFGDSHPQDWTDLGGMGAYSEKWSSLTGPELLGVFRETIDARRAQLASMSDEVFAAPSWTPVGSGSYQKFIDVRVFDFWIHEQDVRVPLGRPGHRSGAAPEIALNHFRNAAGYVLGKGAGLPEGQSCAIRVIGEVAADIFVRTEGRATVVDELSDPTCELTLDHQALLLLGAGRVDPQDYLDEGRVTVEGDTDLGERVVRHLRFVRF